MSFVFYDTETTGTDTSFDQILQFAAIKTDADLKELDRFEIRCRLLPHIVPSPGAMFVTGVPAAKLNDPSLPTHYEMIRTIREKLLSWSPAVFVGYNSLDFDEHLVRQAFYKTLHPPYLTNSGGNSRSDVLTMVQAASLFAPGALTIPTGDNGKSVFKLDRVAPANGFNHQNAHDALADVEATIFLCRLLADRAPDIWSAFMRFSQKAAVADSITTERVFCLADFYYGLPYAWLVTYLGSNSENSSEFYLYDLSIHPESLADLTDEQLAARLKKSPKPIRRVKANASPIIMPVDEAPPIAAAATLSSDELEARITYIENNQGFRDRLIATLEGAREEREPSPHIEMQLYDGFFSPSDLKLCEQFHAAPWESRIAIVEKLEDPRLRLVGLRLIYCEKPALLPQASLRAYHQKVAKRLNGTDTTGPWLSLPKALSDLEDLFGGCEAEDAAFLSEHRQYLSELMKWATEWAL